MVKIENWTERKREGIYYIHLKTECQMVETSEGWSISNSLISTHNNITIYWNLDPFKLKTKAELRQFSGIQYSI